MKNSLLFSVLTPTDKEYFEQNMEIKEYIKEETIFSPLDQCDYLSMIIEGQVKLCKYAADGKEQILSFLGKDDIFGEALVFEGGNYVVTVVAETNCKIGMIHREILLTMSQRNREFTKAFFRELTQKIQLLNNKVEMLSLKTIKQKIARLLLTLSQEQQSLEVKLLYSKQKIALLLGTSREVVSRNFSEMENEGYIAQKGRKVTIIDKDALEDLLLT
ncbi:Crp/Fnr family transcriptional regulator [Irregularibacter muris]|uniref:Crp/Fnr family transcriptional regulator n=1 Tax=Irregularibacter muris TaxID=1796619 RepID=A0AAE3HE39_9FIRM|nr:Crp/Fnr family transcriptional regulator [Irregularibacter muris]MCR1898782.1 Crp/Fnr family transcriptional regulator [Irregularibacter muris]